MLWKPLGGMPLLALLSWETAGVTAFHLGLLWWCVRLPDSALLPSRRRFRPQKWERGGKCYRLLFVPLWKDRMPQYLDGRGFSKAHLEAVRSPAYLHRFLLETCRAEWYHGNALLCVPVLLVLSPPLFGVAGALPLLLIHGGCVLIQRYNRCRLLPYAKRLEKRKYQIPVSSRNTDNTAAKSSSIASNKEVSPQEIYK